MSYKAAPASLMLTANSDSSDINVDLDGFREKESTEKTKEGTIGDAANQLVLNKEYRAPVHIFGIGAFCGPLAGRTKPWLGLSSHEWIFTYGR
nr:hypothetical protein [Paenibacillus thiaminolyticus]